MTSLLLETIAGKNQQSVPPIWFMRQAGRYHSHYQKLRKQHGFDELCRNPDLSAETAMGPIQDFDFDAAILFSDILFPLEALGMPLVFDPAPRLGFLLRSWEDFERLVPVAHSSRPLSFQAEGVAKLRRRLDPRKSLIGFIGSPWTLFVFATCGSHKNDLSNAFAGILDGRFERFCELVTPLLVQTLSDQAASGADALAIFDTAAGDLTATQYQRFSVPALKSVFTEVRKNAPTARQIYYAKGVGSEHWDVLRAAEVGFDVLGIDWQHSIAEVLAKYGDLWAIQGNFDPHLLLASEEEFHQALENFLEPILKIDPILRQSWICGLGHGVLPGTPQARVEKMIRTIRERFA